MATPGAHRRIPAARRRRFFRPLIILAILAVLTAAGAGIAAAHTTDLQKRFASACDYDGCYPTPAVGG
jgi:hypothetical protein